MRDWIEIFKTGLHADSGGNQKTWTEADLDQIVKQYNPRVHEAPVVIGHPVGNAPAYGWVEALKREGKFLCAKLKGLVPEFGEMVRQGLFKKRSISLYPNLTLRHLGFLGAMPPAVKGLADVNFAEQKGETKIEFEEEGGSLSSDQSMPAFKKLSDLTRKKMDEKKDLTYSLAFAEVQRENVDLVMELVEYLEEIRHPDKMAFREGPASKLCDLTRKKMDEKKDLTYSEAFSEVQTENPDLVREYLFGGQDQGADLTSLAQTIERVLEPVRSKLAADPEATSIDTIVYVLDRNPALVRKLATEPSGVPDLTLLAGNIKMVAIRARKMMTGDSNLNPVDAILAALKESPMMVREIQAGSKDIGLL
jgi:hypothetical protein